jgi:hypothetical protein
MQLDYYLHVFIFAHECYKHIEYLTPTNDLSLKEYSVGQSKMKSSPIVHIDNPPKV